MVRRLPWEANQRFSDINGFGRLDNNGDTDTEDMEPDAQDGLVPPQSSKRPRADTPTVAIKQPKSGPRDQPSTRPTQPPMSAPPVTTTAATVAATVSSGSGETPVLMGVTPQLNLFTETHTHVLPLRFGFSMNAISNSASNAFVKIRMNAPYDILGETTFVQQTEGSATQAGPSVHQASAFNINNDGNLASFETTLIPGTNAPTANTAGNGVVAHANCKPGWLSWYEKIYESYHVMETQYRITLVNPETTPGNRVRVYTDKDVYTGTNIGNIMPTNATPFSLNGQFRKVDMHIVSERNNNDDKGWIKVIEGTWVPDTWQKNTRNAEEIKGWYPTTAGPTPTWVENLVMVFRADEYTNAYTNLNVFVELRYIVQFKDLKLPFRYTQPGDAEIALNTPGDVLQVPNTRFNWGNPT